MSVCSTCGREIAAGSRFCPECGAAVAEAPPTHEERKVVSILFCDLVGFTAASETADPEDVRATLRPYHARVKQEIERFGGTVEKFVGDAVMAVFGAPVAHEDDAERAVRAGLRILDEAGELGVELRVAVNTGEAVVSLGARPEQGEAMVAGDVVNTAARLQSAAPVGSVVVGELTRRTTETQIVYDELEPVELKGKAERVRLWRARSARSRFGVDAEVESGTAFVGREHELALLKDVYARVRRDEAVQLVTLVGEPGVGKTRLLRELGRWLDDQDDLVYWRQGRCLPYGEGITFWALGELVKAHAGILESDSPEQAADKLAVAVQIVDDAEREWVRARLAPLVGAADAASASREESFTAWRTFLDAIAAERPLVVLVEDIHWADASLLEFLGDVLDWSNGVPLLVLCTGRPELYDRHPGWGGGKRNSTTVSLAPLSRDETAHLVAALLERSVLPADTQAALLERAGGNPLYAEEFARMFADRGELGEDTPVPETVQALIAARIDTLAPDAKALVHDAAVVGKVFWAGAVAALAGRESADVLEPLNQLVRKELIRPARTSSMEGEREYTFWHALVRDVAYGQIPRGARARKHAAAGAWIEGSVGERASDQAELLAHHYGEALRLTRAADADADTAELQRTAARFLALAGERAMKLDVARAAAYLEEALALWPEDDPAQLDVVVKLSGAQMMDGRPGEALATGERALAAWRDRGDPTLVGGLISSLGAINFNIAQLDESGRLAQEAVLLLEGQPPSPQLVVAYSRLAAREMLLDRPDASIALCRKAIGLAEQLGVPEAPVNLARQMLGSARLAAGDPGGLADVVDALNRALDQGLSLAGPAYVNVAFARWWLEGSQPGIDVYRQGIEMAERRGLVTNARWARAEGLWPLYDLGEWDEILAEIDAILADETASDSQLPAMTLPVVARILAHRGDLDRAAALVGDFLPRARTIGISQVVGLAFPAAGFVALARGDHAGASGILREFAGLSKGRRMQRAMYLTESARVAVAIGERDLAAALIENLNPGGARVGHGLATVEAILAEADGETERAGGLYRAAAALWEDYGSVVERGYALLGAGRCDGNATDLREARAIFARLGAATLVRDVDDLLGDATASSA